MAQDKIKQNDAVKQAQVVDRDEHQKTKESKRLGTYLITVPTVKKKFKDISDNTKSDPNYCDTSEGPFGFGPLVFSCLQRFNTIEFFLISCFVVILAHGKLEEPGCSAERMYSSRPESVTLWKGACGWLLTHFPDMNENLLTQCKPIAFSLWLPVW
jgi:hypothetical protein